LPGKRLARPPTAETASTGDGPDRVQRRLDQATRAAWLYYVGDQTQDEIASRLNVSRQMTQRLIAMARSAGLVQFRIERRAAECAELSERLLQRYGLRFCDVVPYSGRATADVAVSAAEQIEAVLAQPQPVILAIGSGRTLRAAVAQVFPTSCPQHRIVSLVGNITRLGRASPYEVVQRLSDLTGAEYHPMPMPVVADSLEEVLQMQAQRVYRLLHDLVRNAHTQFVGVGNVSRGAPLHHDGFITDAEMDELVGLGAVGEICGRALDRDGRVIDHGTNARVMAIPLDDPSGPTRIGIAAGELKVEPLRAALRGGWLSGLITDEPTAAAILKD
jgi:DNA-binding transcriptional regulator LsrR (DeoR family)